MTSVKICGIRDAAALAAVEHAGTDFIGFNFVPESPRYLPLDIAAGLTRMTAAKKVGLFVDPDDDTLASTLRHVPLDMIQLHGDETPSRVAAIRAAYNLPVMKVIRLAGREDLAPIGNYEQTADWLMFDTKTTGAHGGTGRTFDWMLLKDYKGTKPWMLAGGLNPDNVKDALGTLSPTAVDVSSGVESAPGIKDAGKIAAFIATVRHA